MKTIYDVSMKHAQNLNLIPTRHLHKKAKKTVDTRCSRIMLSWAFQPKPEPNILTGNLNLRMVQLLQRSTAFLDSNLMNSTWGMVIFLLILCPTPPKMKQHVYLHNTKKIHIPLKPTASLALKINGWKVKLPFWDGKFSRAWLLDPRVHDFNLF